MSAVPFLPLAGAFLLFLGCILSLCGAVAVSDAFTRNPVLRRVYLRDAASSLGAAVVAFALASLAFTFGA